MSVPHALPGRAHRAHPGRSLLPALVAAWVTSSILAGVTAAATPSPPAEGPPPDSIRAWIPAGRLAEADSAARVLLRRAEAKHGAESLEAAEAIDLIVETIWRARRANTPEARPLAERAVHIKERLLPPDDIRLASSWTNLAQILNQFGDPAAARPLLERTLELQERVLGRENLSVASTLSLLAIVLTSLGELQETRELRNRTLAIREALLPPGDTEIANALTGLALVEVTSCEYEAAQEHYHRALIILETAHGREHLSVALVLSNLARLQNLMGDYASARATFERAAAIQRTAGPTYRPLGFTMTYLGLTLREMGDIPAARDTLARALALRIEALGPDHPLVANTLSVTGDFLNEIGELEQARNAYRRSLEIRSRARGSKEPNDAAALLGLSDVALQSGSIGEADSLCSEAVAILRSAHGARAHPVARALIVQSKLRLRRGDLDGARALLEQARDTEVALLGEDHPEVADATHWLARVELADGRREDALLYALRAERIGRDHLRQTGRALSEREAMAYASTRAGGLDIALTLAQSGMPDSSMRRICDSVIRSRSIVLDEMASRNRMSSSGDSTLDRLAHALTRATRHFSRLVVRGPDDSHSEWFAAELDAARRARERAERELGERSAEFRRERSVTRIGLNDVTSSLPNGSAVIAYVRYSDISASRGPITAAESTRTVYGAFVIQRQTVTYVPLGSADGIDEQVRRWRGEVERGLADAPARRTLEAACRSAGARLRRAIWDPLEPALQRASRVFIVPEGMLSLVPFEALPTGSDGYLVDSETLISYLSAERDVVRNVGTSKNTTLLAIGGLDFNDPGLFVGLRGPQKAGLLRTYPRVGSRAGSAFRGPRTSCVDFQSVRFTPLPGSQKEVADLAKAWDREFRSHGPARSEKRDAGTCVRLTRSEGSEAAFKELAPRAGVVHLATHGFFIDETCPTSNNKSRGIGGIAPRPARPAAPLPSSAPRRQPRENPLLLSGLALAGANHRDAAGESEEDAILTSEEIAAMDLSGVQWVVLSACDTGIGRTTTGEGVQGLRRSFQVAGASTLFMSLWPVEDEATRQWMRLLYRARWADHLESASATRQASRSLLRRLRHERQGTNPGLWAGFVMVGDWR